jgi:hypothetical protein
MITGLRTGPDVGGDQGRGGLGSEVAGEVERAGGANIHVVISRGLLRRR